MDEPRWTIDEFDPDRDLPPVEHHDQPDEDPPDLDPAGDES